MQDLSRNELLALLRAAKAKRQRDWLMILVAFWHGLRASEVVGLTTDAVRGGYITVERLKGSERTTQALVADSNPLLNERHPLIDFISHCDPGERIFPLTREYFWRLVHRYSEQAGIPIHKAHPHALKHSIAKQLLPNTPVNLVQKRLGHKSLSSTGQYLKSSDEDADRAVQRAFSH